MMVPFNLHAYLATPFTARQPIHLDALLLAARDRREGQTDLSRPLDCLALDRGIYRASAGLMVASGIQGAAVMPIRRVWRFRVEDHQGLSFFRTAPDMPVDERRLKTTNSKYRNGFRRQELLTGIQSVAWQGLGDPDAVLELAKEIHCLGASSVSGFGQVREWRLERTDATLEAVGWHAGSRVLRNLPLELVPEGVVADGLNTVEDVQRVCPPYWDAGERVRCLVPAFGSLVVSADTADEYLLAA